MTKYFLNSGGIKNSSDKGVGFFNEILSNVKSNPKILICIFAQPREDWEEKFNDDKNFFEKNSSIKIKPTLELAFPQTFED